MFITPEYLDLIGPRFYRVIASTGPVLSITWHPSFAAAMDAASLHETARIFDFHGWEVMAFDCRRTAA